MKEYCTNFNTSDGNFLKTSNKNCALNENPNQSRQLNSLPSNNVFASSSVIQYGDFPFAGWNSKIPSLLIVIKASTSVSPYSDKSF